MPTPSLADVPASLQAVLASHGFTELMPVQKAVLAVENRGVDLRISSQTGSGKTVAVGMLLAENLERAEADGRRVCVPRALVVTPTRELAMQVGQELSWLLKAVGARVACATGGTRVGAEQRELGRGAEVVVATPGRLLDHLVRGVIDPSRVHAVVLDEADQMLDLGFREELESILEKLPRERRTHMVSATFSRQVLDLARRYQQDAHHVQGTTLGVSNVDIQHVVHVVQPGEIFDALVNLLLMAPHELALVFAGTRADVTSLAAKLSGLGFSAAGLTGEMEQAERNRVMESFRAGVLRTLVATDVAARGIDVPDVTRVIQVDPPKNPDAHTHRSGRTGRAGRKGTSVVIVPPAGRASMLMLMRRAGIRPWFAPVPDAQAIMKANDARLVSELTTPPAPRGEGEWEPHLHALATRLLAEVDPHTLVHRLLAQLNHHGSCPPRTVTPVAPPPPRPRPTYTPTPVPNRHTPGPPPAADRGVMPWKDKRSGSAAAKKGGYGRPQKGVYPARPTTGPGGRPRQGKR
jgi:ATP-dependent RNA helicase DeaD